MGIGHFKNDRDGSYTSFNGLSNEPIRYRKAPLGESYGAPKFFVSQFFCRTFASAPVLKLLTSFFCADRWIALSNYHNICFVLNLVYSYSQASDKY